MKRVWGLGFGSGFHKGGGWISIGGGGEGFSAFGGLSEGSAGWLPHQRPCKHPYPQSPDGDSPGRSIVVQSTAVVCTRFTPHLRVANAFGVVFRNLNLRAGYCRSLHSFRLTTAGRFALRASAHWAHTSLRRHWAHASLRCPPRGKEPFWGAMAKLGNQQKRKSTQPAQNALFGRQEKRSKAKVLPAPRR